MLSNFVCNHNQKRVKFLYLKCKLITENKTENATTHNSRVMFFAWKSQYSINGVPLCFHVSHSSQQYNSKNKNKKNECFMVLHAEHEKLIQLKLELIKARDRGREKEVLLSQPNLYFLLLLSVFLFLIIDKCFIYIA